MPKKRGFLAGAAIGAVVAGGLALLFAPKAGKELREDIAQKAKDLSEEIDQKIEQAKKDAAKLKGDEKKKRLATIEKAKSIKQELDARAVDFANSRKKITKVAAREADKLMQDGRALLAEMEVYGSIVGADVKDYARKAAKSGQKLAKTTKKEIKKPTK